MELNRRGFLKGLGYTGVSLLVSDKLLKAEESSTKEKNRLIVPTLEEIIALLSKTPQGILQPAIKDGSIKEFEYTKQTTSKDFYNFLNNHFNEKIVFVYFTIDENTKEKSLWLDNPIKIKGADSGAATIFFYTAINLKSDYYSLGFLSIQLKDFYGQQNWDELKEGFNKKLYFPSFVEFKKEGELYQLSDIVKAGTENPKIISAWIEELVMDYRKRTSK